MECTICFEPLSLNKQHHPIMPCCKKKIHKSCFENWKDRNLTNSRCPCCNTRLPLVDLRNIQKEINNYIDCLLFSRETSNRYASLLDPDETEYKYILPRHKETEHEIIFLFEFKKRFLTICLLKPFQGRIQLDLIDLIQQTKGLLEENEPCIIFLE